MKKFVFFFVSLLFLVSCSGSNSGSKIQTVNHQKEPKGVDGVIYYSPHQDDEILSMGPAIRKDLSKGKDVYVFLISDGSTSGLFGPINEKLEKENFPTLTREEFSEARTREMGRSLEELGLDLNNFHTANIVDDGSVTPEVVYELGKELVDELDGERFHHKTLGEFEFEENGTHLACFNGVEKLAKDREEPATFFYGVAVEKMDPLPENRIVPETEEDREKVLKALEAYNIWDPENGFYAVGYQSVRYAFNRELKNPTSYIIKEINID